MKRYNALLVSLAVPLGALIILVLLFVGVGGYGLPAVLAHSSTVDGDAADWFTPVPLPPVNNGHVMRNASYEGEFIWQDAVGDHRDVGDDPDTNYDLTELRITADDTNLYFLLRFDDLTNADLPYISIAVDTTRDGTGNDAFGDSADVATHADAEWERQIIANSNRTGYFSGAAPYVFTAAGSSAIATDTDIVEIGMPLADLEIDLTDGAVVRFTVSIGQHDGAGGLAGSYIRRGALDVVTTAATTYPGEISEQDGVIDYFFDVYFELDGDPTSPLQISEVFYDPLGGTEASPQPELSNEFIELYNPAQYLAYLDGMVLGDEPNDQGTTDPTWREANFQFPGIPLTGTMYIVEPQAYVVIANDARAYDDDPPLITPTLGFPDHYWADWEFFQGVTDEFDSPDVPNLALVYGETGAAAQAALGNQGDGVLLADGTIADPGTLSFTLAYSYSMVDGLNWESWEDDIVPADTKVDDKHSPWGPEAVEGMSLQRDYTRTDPDTDNSWDDFRPAGLPTPGFAKGKIDHSIYKMGPDEVEAGDIFDYYVYYQVAGGTAFAGVITDVLPSGVEFMGFVSDRAISLVDSVEPTIVWDLGSVPANTIGKITVTVQLAPEFSGTMITQTASIGSNSALDEGITANDTAVLTSTVLAPELSVEKMVETATAPAQPGDVVTYTVTLSNAGVGVANGVVMTDNLPSALTFGEWLDQGSAMPSMPTETITWGPWDVAAGQEYSFRFTAVITTNAAVSGDTITNTVEYSSDNAGEGSDDAAFDVMGPDIAFVTPTDGQVFIAANNVSVTVPIEVATTDFDIPDDGYWNLLIDETLIGSVMTYTTDADLTVGDHTLQAVLFDTGQQPLGPTDTVTVTVTGGSLTFLPIVLNQE